MQQFSAIPTNVIGGFLGAGKTTAIQYLLQQRPENERWAVIVNEFGQVGIDGELLKNDQVEVKEIAGGCLCCVGSQSLNVGLNQVIRAVNPHRIIIEPTGLGHPAKLIANLRGDHYQTVLDLKAIIVLVDARQLRNEKYTTHETFIDQLQMADILVASKMDAYTEEDAQLFYEYVSTLKPARSKLAMIEQGMLDPAWLELPGSTNISPVYADSHHHDDNHSHENEHKDCDHVSSWVQVEGRADGFVSSGWRMASSLYFNYQALHDWLVRVQGELSLDRIKAVLRTEQGWMGINMTDKDLAIQLLSKDEQAFPESKLEMIAMEGNQSVDFIDINQQLLDLNMLKERNESS